MRKSHLVIGVAVAVMGFALMVIALAHQGERTSATGAVPACAPGETVAHPIPASTEPTGTTVPASTTTTIPTAATTAPLASASATAAASASPPPVASSEAADAQENRLFKFSPGGAAMSNDEVMKVLALGKALAHHPAAKVSIEGFGDLAGTDPLMMGIAKHRAKVGQTLLGKAGVAADRVTLSFSDMGSDLRLARSIRVTTTPPISEVEKP